MPRWGSVEPPEAFVVSPSSSIVSGVKRVFNTSVRDGEPEPCGSELMVVADEFTEDGWKIRIVLTIQNGKPIVRNVSVSPRDRRRVPQGGISGKRLAEISLEAALRRGKATIKNHTAGRLADTAAWTPVLANQLAKPVRKGDLGDFIYADIAREYVELLAAGEKAPSKRIAARRNYSVTYVGTCVSEARHRGLLTPTKRGVPGGVLTPKGLAVLAAGPVATP